MHGPFYTYVTVWLRMMHGRSRSKAVEVTTTLACLAIPVLDITALITLF